MTVLTTVTDAFRPSALPFSVVIAVLLAVENVTPEYAIMVPTMVPPPAPLMVAALPTCQKTFLARAPLIRMTLRGAPAAPTVSVDAIWKTQTAFAFPWASRVRSDPVIRKEPLRLYRPQEQGLARPVGRRLDLYLLVFQRECYTRFVRQPRPAARSRMWR